MKRKPNEDLSPIRDGEVYPLTLFMQRTGLGPKAIRTARKSGLIVRRVGTRSYVKVADFLHWYDSQPAIAG